MTVTEHINLSKITDKLNKDIIGLYKLVIDLNSKTTHKLSIDNDLTVLTNLLDNLSKHVVELKFENIHKKQEVWTIEPETNDSKAPDHVCDYYILKGTIDKETYYLSGWEEEIPKEVMQHIANKLNSV